VDDDTASVLDARHLVATAAGNISAAAAQATRALAWQLDQEVSTIEALEITVKSLQIAERQLVDAINELRIATKKHKR
jgi:hypothetical protein